MVRVDNISFSYNGSRILTFPSFVLQTGEHSLLLGESGSGKTTLLHLLGGLLHGYKGTIQIDGTEISSLSESALDQFRGKKMGFIFQKNHLISALTVEKNLRMASFLSGVPVAEDRIDTILKQLGISEIKKSSVMQISHGQAQRVAIARAVLTRPPVIFADEPTSALDDKSCDRVINLLLDVASHNQATLVVATHDQRLKNKIQNQIQLH